MDNKETTDEFYQRILTEIAKLSDEVKNREQTIRDLTGDTTRDRAIHLKGEIDLLAGLANTVFGIGQYTYNTHPVNTLLTAMRSELGGLLRKWEAKR